MTSKFDLEHLLLNHSLYSPIKFEITEALDVAEFIFMPTYKTKYDSFCVECKKESTFALTQNNRTLRLKFEERTNGELLEFIQSDNEPSKFSFNCQRDSNHKSYFYFLVKGYTLEKIGQSPSIASIQIASIKKYQRVLQNDYKDFAKAIGLYSHGVGIGSFVYLRRIFENLIFEMRTEKLNDKSWDDSKFQDSRMDEKIKMLEEMLPEVLVTNRKLYGIISKGIHELSEEECLKLFPDIQLAIELILDEKVHLIEKQAKIKRVGTFVSQTIEKINKKD